MLIEIKVAQALINQKKTLALAESCSGGLLAHRLTNLSGSSAFLQLGLITYHDTAKSKLLKIPLKMLKKHGAVSKLVASAMAANVRKILNTDFGVSISGIAGPTGGSKNKPVGLVFIAVATPKETICLECRFKGTRENIKKQSATQALELLSEFLCI